MRSLTLLVLVLVVAGACVAEAESVCSKGGLLSASKIKDTKVLVNKSEAQAEGYAKKNYKKCKLTSTKILKACKNGDKYEYLAKVTIGCRHHRKPVTVTKYITSKF